MPRLAVIADDLTGANDTGVQFGKFGLKTIVLLGELGTSALPEEADVIVADTDSRSATASVAFQRVENVCRFFCRKGIRSVYKKIDSTLRGNLGAEISAVCREYSPLVTVIAPAYPQNRRTTIGGHQLLAGMPVSLTEMAHDPKTPVAESWLPKILQSDTDHKVGMVSLQTVMQGPSAIRAAMNQHLSEGTDWLVFDAVREEDLRHIAQAAVGFERVLWVGSAGLAEQLPGIFQWTRDGEKKAVPVTAGPVLVVAGSVSEVTQRQIETYVAKTGAGHVRADSVAAIVAPSAESRRIISKAAPLLEKKNIVISCSNDRQVMARTAEAGKSIGIASHEIGVRIAAVLGQAVAGLAKQGVQGLFLTGGETAVSSCQTLGAAGIEIISEVVPGIPLGRLIGGPFHGLPVITKAGAFGDEQAIIAAINVLKGQEEQSI